MNTAVLLHKRIGIGFALDNARLAKRNRDIIGNASDTRRAACMASVWEMATLAYRGRLKIDYTPRVWVNTLCKEMGLKVIVSTARQCGFTLMTQDKAILAYAKGGHVRVA